MPPINSPGDELAGDDPAGSPRVQLRRGPAQAGAARRKLAEGQRHLGPGERPQAEWSC